MGRQGEWEGKLKRIVIWMCKCHYLDPVIARELYTTYDHILGKLVNMILHPEHWTIGE